MKTGRRSSESGSPRNNPRGAAGQGTAGFVMTPQRWRCGIVLSLGRRGGKREREGREGEGRERGRRGEGRERGGGAREEREGGGAREEREGEGRGKRERGGGGGRGKRVISHF